MSTVGELVDLDDKEFKYLTTMLYERFGIHLGDQKRILVSGRLSKRLHQLGLVSFTQYIDYLAADASGAELSEMINRITTNHSFFFREREHFDFLEKTVFPEIEKKSSDFSRYPLRIWSAGCAGGEEVFSLGMLLREHFKFKLDSMDYGLLATDISLAALAEAGKGEYAATKLNELPVAYRHAYFQKITNDTYAVKDEIKSMVMFKRLNLMAESYPMHGLFDVIFCRNVMIYFDAASREKVVKTMFRYVKPGGYFFIGHSESLKRENCLFQYIKPAIYRKGDS